MSQAQVAQALILATQEAEIGRIKVQDRANSSQDSILKKPTTRKGC
jgi:hypothetical protein